MTIGQRINKIKSITIWVHFIGPFYSQSQAKAHNANDIANTSIEFTLEKVYI